jgi:hypothetical protein
MFFAAELRPFSHHLSPAFHHKSTIKKPPFATTFSQKPRKNAVSPVQRKIRKKSSRTEVLPN